MNDSTRRTGDIAVAPNWYVYVMDGTTGQVITHVGPTKTSPSDNEYPVIYEPRNSRYERTTPEASLLPFVHTKRNQYVILTNPAKDGNQPIGKGKSENFTLSYGERVNLSGPCAFPLWPGQEAKVIDGHHLRTNQYLVVRVYDEDAARNSMGDAVVRTLEDGSDEKVLTQDSLVTGNLMIIKGTDVRFFIPPTGIEVIADDGNYVRDAVTLESLEYCVLIAENGEKRYVYGPDVVFPEPSEKFESDSTGSRKFKAIELNDNSGIFVKVIRDYKEDDKIFAVGDELFITGKDEQFYYPRPEHSIVMYGNQKVHYAVAVPEGEGRYVLDRNTGEVDLIDGPKMLLLDPREKVFIRRALTDSEAELYYPGNNKVRSLNETLREAADDTGYIQDDVLANTLSSFGGMRNSVYSLQSKGAKESVSHTFMSDKVSRKEGFTPPRMITLDSKFDGAIKVKPWTGFAVMVVGADGERTITVGPDTVLLDYDQQLEAMSLSTGKPKTTDNLERTVYLQTQANKVSDIVTVLTADMVEVSIKVSYMVNFVGDDDAARMKWFNIDNYVKYLCDHMRTTIKAVALKVTAQKLFNNYIEIVKNAVLGEEATHLFAINNMELYDVEVLTCHILNAEIRTALEDHQSQLSEMRMTLEMNQAQEENDQRQVLIDDAVRERNCRAEEEEIRNSVSLDDLRHGQIAARLIAEESEEKLKALVQNLEEIARKLLHEGNLTRAADVKELETKYVIANLEAETTAKVEQAQAISPELVAALTSLSETGMMRAVAEHLAPLAVVKGLSIGQVLSELLQGTSLEKIVKAVAQE